MQEALISTVVGLNREKVAAIFEGLGVEFLGVTNIEVRADFNRYREWLHCKLHAGMSYMAREPERREDPRFVFAEAKCCVAFALSYGGLGRDEGFPPRNPLVARYARFKDYHKQMWALGEQALQAMQKERPCLKGRVAVDSAPLLERALAAKTREGFIGKNTLYIHPRKGSFMLLGELLLDEELEFDPVNLVDSGRRADGGGCGSCRRCQVHCPTGALDEAYKLDANKCLSYWTIEHRGEIPRKYWKWLQLYWYGCDLCQQVCPYNREVKSSRVLESVDRLDKSISLKQVAMMSQEQYEAWFGGFPMTRAKREGLMRNALIALYVSGSPDVGEVLSVVKGEEGLPVLVATARQILREQESLLV